MRKNNYQHEFAVIRVEVLKFTSSFSILALVVS